MQVLNESQGVNVNDRNKVWELQNIISKMPLNVCYSAVLPEFGIRWKDVSRAVRNNRMPMESASIARVLCRHLTKYADLDNLDDILARLRLQLIAHQPRTWHVLLLEEPTEDDIPIQELSAELPQRLYAALRGYKKTMMADVHSIIQDSLVYVSVQFTSGAKRGCSLYLAAPPRQPVALVSTLAADKLLKICVQGLGYSSYTRANLHGSDIPSLLRIADPAWRCAPDQLTGAQRYDPVPLLAPDSIQYNNQQYDLEYVDNILGPNPPLLTSLHIRTTSSFFEKSLLNKSINLSLNLKSENVVKTLRTWVAKGAIAPNSAMIHLFHKMKSNRITLANDNDGSE